VTITALDGSITDSAADDTVNITADVLTLTADTGIGTKAAGEDIETTVGTLVATTASGDIVIDETNALILGMGGNGVTTASSDIQITADGTITVSEAVTANGAGDVSLTASGGSSDIEIKANIQTDSGDIELTAGRSITTDSAGDVIATMNDSGTLALRAVDAIGTTSNRIDTDVDTIAAEITGVGTTGDIFINQTDGIQKDLMIGTTTGANPLSGIATANNNDIAVVTQAGTLTVACDWRQYYRYQWW